jgi:hypothetical protein
MLYFSRNKCRLTACTFFGGFDNLIVALADADLGACRVLVEKKEGPELILHDFDLLMNMMKRFMTHDVSPGGIDYKEYST